MRAIVGTSNVCCGTCQSWVGDRRYEHRLNRVVCEYSGALALDACSMNYKKASSTQVASCRGYVRWCELG